MNVCDIVKTKVFLYNQTAKAQASTTKHKKLFSKIFERLSLIGFNCKIFQRAGIDHNDLFSKMTSKDFITISKKLEKFNVEDLR